MSKPIGVLGGIFDPVHHGHLAVGMLAYEHFKLDKLLYIPSGHPPHKAVSVCASPAQRLIMLQRTLLNLPGMHIWDREMQRPGTSYTIDTIRELQKTYPNSPLYFIVGADNLHEIHSWHRYEEILTQVTLCVTERPGYSQTTPSTLKNAQIKWFPSPNWGASSSQIRRLLADGYSCRYLLPQTVLDYIAENNLYTKLYKAPKRST